MSVFRTKEAAPQEPSTHWRISIVVVVVAVSSLGASATSLGKAVDPVGAAAPEIRAPTPSLPSVTPPPQPAVPTPPPRAPGEVPSTPQVPAIKAPSPKAPGTAPNSSRPVPVPAHSSGSATPRSGSGVDPPSVNDLVSGTKGSSGGPTEAADREAPSVRSRGSAGSDDGNGSGGHGVLRAGVGAGSVDPAQAAPLRVLFAYVWPAIALGPVGELLGMLPARGEVALSLPVSDIPRRLLSGLTGVSEEARVAGLSARSVSSDPPPGDSRGLPIPSGSEISFLVAIIACTALMALLAFTIRREFRSMHRWPS